MKKYFSIIMLFLATFILGNKQANFSFKILQPKAFNAEEINNNYKINFDEAKDITSYLPENFVKDGSIDYTKFIQKGINENIKILMPNFPVLVNDKGLVLHDNVVLLFDKKSKIVLKPTTLGTYNILKLHNIKNVKIYYPRIEGDIKKHLGSDGEWGMGIGIRSSQNIGIYYPEIENCWGDGIYVGFIWDKKDIEKFDISKNIEIYNGFINNSGRNGISVVAVDSIKIYNNLIANSVRTLPKAGIDIEPGPKLTMNIELSNNVTYKNGLKGIDIYLKKMARKKGDNSITLNIKNHKDLGSPIGIRIAGYNKETNRNYVKGKIIIDNPILRDNSLNQIEIDKDQSYAPPINIRVKNDKKLLNSLNKNKSSNKMIIN
jgi:hypothetical protein